MRCPDERVSFFALSCLRHVWNPEYVAGLDALLGITVHTRAHDHWKLSTVFGVPIAKGRCGPCGFAPISLAPRKANAARATKGFHHRLTSTMDKLRVHRYSHTCRVAGSESRFSMELELRCIARAARDALRARQRRSGAPRGGLRVADTTLALQPGSSQAGGLSVDRSCSSFSSSTLACKLVPACRLRAAVLGKSSGETDEAWLDLTYGPRANIARSSALPYASSPEVARGALRFIWSPLSPPLSPSPPPPSPPSLPGCSRICSGGCDGFSNPSFECSRCDSRAACHPGAPSYNRSASEANS